MICGEPGYRCEWLEALLLGLTTIPIWTGAAPTARISEKQSYYLQYFKLFQSCSAVLAVQKAIFGVVQFDPTGISQDRVSCL